jgi:hypothetical protein
MKRISALGFVTAAVTVCLAMASPATGAPLLLNGGFEAGFANWARADQLGSDGTFFQQSGTLSPINGDLVPAPSGGLNAAMSDGQGPGSHVLYQDFLVDSTSGTLSFDLFIGNRAGDFFTPSAATVGLDFSTPAINQQARVDILRSGTDPFSVASSDVLLNLYQSGVGDPAVSGYTTFSIDVSALLAANLGQTLRLRFAETDNLAPFQMGVDNVTFDSATPVPEPASLVLLGTGLVALRARRRRS